MEARCFLYHGFSTRVFLLLPKDGTRVTKPVVRRARRPSYPRRPPCSGDAGVAVRRSRTSSREDSTLRVDRDAGVATTKKVTIHAGASLALPRIPRSSREAKNPGR